MTFKIFLEGNIGSGKTSFLNMFRGTKQLMGLEEILILEEPVEVWKDVKGRNVLGKFYENPKRYAFQMQSLVQLTLLRQHVQQEKLRPVISIQERSLFSSFHVFKRELEGDGLLTETEARILEEGFEFLTSGEIGDFGADLIIYLRTDPKVALSRVRERGRKEEKGISLKKLESLHRCYEDWLINKGGKKHPEKILVVEANGNKVKMEEEFHKVWEFIARAKGERKDGGV